MNNEQLLQQAVIVLSSVCDGARKQDAVGFNGVDSPYGKFLASLPFTQWTPKMKASCYKMLRKYRKQLLTHGIDYNEIPEPQYQTPQERLLTTSGNLFKFTFPYPKHEQVRNAIKSPYFDLKPRWDSVLKAWFVTADKAPKVLEFAREYEFTIADDVETLINKLPTTKHEQPKNNRQVTVLGNQFVIKFDYDAALVTAVKNELPRPRFDGQQKFWTLPAIAGNVNALVSFTEKHGFDLTQPAQDQITKLGKETEYQEIRAGLSRAGAINSESISGLGGELRLFQNVVPAYVETTKQVLIADEMGLGKTVEALASIQKINGYPALVVCPASLKLNWYKEATKWLPGKTVSILNGKENNYSTDIVICNYDILSKHFEQLNRRGFKTIIFDEFHYCKNRKAQRLITSLELAKNIEYRIGLTGTPVLNRPVELVQQLIILDKLTELGGFWPFVKRYCNAVQTKYGWDLTGASHLEELNEKLRAVCYIRRTKKEVLAELPEKQRAVISLELTNRAEYDKAEKNLIQWLKDTGEAEAATAASKAEQLARIEHLKQLAVTGKIEAVIEWIETFLESGEKLVLFATHKNVVKTIAEHFKAPSITGDTSLTNRDRIVESFQNDPTTNLVVCNIRAGGVGLTLTAASNVAFVELDWNPGTMDQAEDRTHRIGQKNNVTAWYLLADNSIDNEIFDLIQTKRGVVNSATDGTQTGPVDQSILNELINKMKKGA